MAESQIVSYSELDTYRQCPYKHELAYKQRWVGETKSVALSRGTLWHQVLETHYKYLRSLQKAEHTAWSELQPETLTHLVGPLLIDQNTGEPLSDDHALILRMYRDYLSVYEFDPQWKILAVEFAAQVPLRDPAGRRSRFALKLKIDLVVKENGRIWIVDHKSCKDLPTEKQLDLDDQFGLYTWAMQQLGYKVWGSVHSASRTWRPKDPDKDTRSRNSDGMFLNKDGSISKDQPHLYDVEAQFGRRLLVRQPRELETVALEAYRTAQAAYRWKPGEAPRAPDPDRCGWRCDYTEPCLMARKGRDQTEVLVDFGFSQDFTRH